MLNNYQSINAEDDNRTEEIILNILEVSVITICCCFWVFTAVSLFASIYYDIKND